MTPLQKVVFRLSEVRARLNEISGLEAMLSPPKSAPKRAGSRRNTRIWKSSTVPRSWPRAMQNNAPLACLGRKTVKRASAGDCSAKHAWAITSYRRARALAWRDGRRN